MLEKIKTYIKYIVIILLSIGLVISVSQCNKQKTEVEKIQTQLNVQKKINEIEQGQTEIVYRETNIYPKIDKRLKEIEQQIKDNNTRVTNEIKNSSIDNLHQLYKQLNYSSSIIR